MFSSYKDISSRESYEFYRQNRKRIAIGINQYNLFKKAVEGLFSLVANKLAKTEHGICIRDLGYFCVLRSKEKTRINVPKYHDSILKSKRRGYRYTPVWFPDVMYDGWYMNGSFRSKVYENISRSSIEYKIHSILCEGMIVAEDFAEKNLTENYRKRPERRDTYKKENRK